VGEEWRMIFEGPESKSGRAFEITVPENLVPFFEYYLREVRPKFTGADRHNGVWASTKGGPLTANAIADVITERTREAFGQSVHPHLFRHCAATTIAVLQPGRICAARRRNCGRACRPWLWCQPSSTLSPRRLCWPLAASQMDAGPRRLWRSAPMACVSGRGWWRRENQPCTPSTSAASSPPAASGEQTVHSSIFGPEGPHFNPMRVIRNRVVEEWNDRLSEVPTRRDNLPEIGRTRFLGQDMVMRKINVILPVVATEGDWEEMPWLGGQGIGLIHDIPSAADAVERMMAEAGDILGRLARAIRR